MKNIHSLTAATPSLQAVLAQLLAGTTESQKDQDSLGELFPTFYAGLGIIEGYFVRDGYCYKAGKPIAQAPMREGIILFDTTNPSHTRIFSLEKENPKLADPQLLDLIDAACVPYSGHDLRFYF